MIPIYEQGSGRGIGHGKRSFLERFDQICSEHVAKGRAKSFAFLCYNFEDYDLRTILKDEGVFTRLDRLAGDNLSIFYLHEPSNREATVRFNHTLTRKIGIKGAHPPCVVFFKFDPGGGFADVAVAQLDSADLIHGFEELYGIIEDYITSGAQKPGSPRSIRWIRSAGAFLSLEVIRDLIERLVSHLF